MVTKQSALEIAVRSYLRYGPVKGVSGRVSQHFSTEHHLFRALAGDLQIAQIPLRVQEWLTSLDKKIQEGVREIYYEGFLIVPRKEAPRILKEIVAYAQALRDLQQYSSRRAQTEHLSKELSIHKNLIENLLAGIKPETFTPEIIKVHSYLASEFGKAIRSLEHNEIFPEIPARYRLKNREDLYSLIARAMMGLLGEDNVGASKYIIKKLGEFKEIRQLTRRIETVRRSYRFPSNESVHRYINTIAGLSKAHDEPKKVSGIREPFTVHRKPYAVALALFYRKIYLKGQKSGPRLPVNHEEYKPLIEELMRNGIGRRDLPVTLKPILEIKPKEVYRRFIRGKDFMFYEQYQKLKDYAQFIAKS